MEELNSMEADMEADMLGQMSRMDMADRMLDLCFILDVRLLSHELVSNRRMLMLTGHAGAQTTGSMGSYIDVCSSLVHYLACDSLADM